jgi:ABC-2 type transport system permease protein
MSPASEAAASSPAPPGPGLFATWRRYAKIYRISLVERLVYRADFILSTFLRFLPMLTTILLWQAIYAGSGREVLGQPGLPDYRLNEMIAYLLLVHISRMFSSMPGLAHGIARDIRDGNLKKYLLQPIEMVPYLVAYRMAHKTAYIATSALPYAILFFVCRGFFDRFPPDAWTWAAYVAALLMGFVIGFFFEATIGMAGFWFLEVGSFLYIINTLSFFVSGHMFPLDRSPGRYLRLWLAFARFGLIREMAFRGNFVVKVFVELLWLGLLLIFYDTVFAQTSVVATWTRAEYMFFVGCYFMLEGLIETFVMSNCGEFAGLIRSGDLDFYLLVPIDEQFLVSLREVDWTTLPNVLIGLGIMGFSLRDLGWSFDALQALAFLSLFLCGAAMAYSFLLMLAASSVWLMRNQSLYELWWLFTTLMRYPREIFTHSWAAPLGFFFTFVIPVLLVVNVPARVMVKPFEGGMVYLTAALTVAVTAALLAVSRVVFRFALRRYRSASS